MQIRFTKIIALALCFLLAFQQSGFAQVAGQLDISGHLLSLKSSFIQDKFRPLHLRYLDYNTANNNFRLLLDKGDLKPDELNGPNGLNEQTKKLMQYFFIGISLPNESFWVNLRPDAQDNIIDPFLAQTDLGRVLLEADLQLKKDTAKFTSPETPEGRQYWNKLYQKAEELLGYDNITIPTLTRPWIVPGEIIIRETAQNAYIYKATLKVMLEQDYLTSKTGLTSQTDYSFKDPRLKALNEYASELIRELIIPKLTKEINTSQRYAPLRQVYYSLILAQWFKQRFKGLSPSKLSEGNLKGTVPDLIDSHNLTGLTSQAPWSKNTYFKQYQKSFQEGEYNLKEPVRIPFGQSIRTYMSGGIAFGGEIAVALSQNKFLSSKPLPQGIVNSNIALEVTGEEINITNLPRPEEGLSKGASSPVFDSESTSDRDKFKDDLNEVIRQQCKLIRDRKGIIAGHLARMERLRLIPVGGEARPVARLLVLLRGVAMAVKQATGYTDYDTVIYPCSGADILSALSFLDLEDTSKQRTYNIVTIDRSNILSGQHSPEEINTAISDYFMGKLGTGISFGPYRQYLADYLLEFVLLARRFSPDEDRLGALLDSLRVVDYQKQGQATRIKVNFTINGHNIEHTHFAYFLKDEFDTKDEADLFVKDSLEKIIANSSRSMLISKAHSILLSEQDVSTEVLYPLLKDGTVIISDDKFEEDRLKKSRVEAKLVDLKTAETKDALSHMQKDTPRGGIALRSLYWGYAKDLARQLSIFRFEKKILPENNAPPLIKSGLANQIAKHILNKGGKISFAEFQDIVQKEYYANVAEIGEGKDFSTYAENEEFAGLVAEQLVEMWQKLNMDVPLGKFSVVEMEAGNGTMAYNIIEYINEKYPEFYHLLEYVIIEFSNKLIARQREKLARYGDRVRWINKSVLELGPGDLRDIEGIFVSNELPDDFPVHRIRKVSGKLKEVYVSFDQERGIFKDLLGELSYEVMPYASTLNMKLPEGAELPVNLALVRWQENISKILKRGFVLTLDYGGRPEEIGQAKPYAVWNKQFDNIADIYKNIAENGALNITSDVDIVYLNNIAKNVGMPVVGATFLRDFLWNLGLGTDRIEPNKLEREVSGDFMFKVVVQSKDFKDTVALKGFEGISGFNGAYAGDKVRVQIPLTLSPGFLAIAERGVFIPPELFQKGKDAVGSYLDKEYKAVRYYCEVITNKDKRKVKDGFYISELSRKSILSLKIFDGEGRVIFDAESYFARYPQQAKEFALSKEEFNIRMADRVNLDEKANAEIPEMFVLNASGMLEPVVRLANGSSPIGGQGKQKKLKDAQSIASRLTERMQPYLKELKQQLWGDSFDASVVKEACDGLVALIREETATHQALKTTLTIGGVFKDTDLINPLTSISMVAQVVGANTKKLTNYLTITQNAFARVERIAQSLTLRDKFVLDENLEVGEYIILPLNQEAAPLLSQGPVEIANKPYYAELISNPATVSATIDAWFVPGKKRYFDEGAWRNLANNYPEGVLVKLQSGSGDILGMGYFHKDDFLLPEEGIHKVYIGDLIEISEELRGKDLGKVILAKIIEFSNNDSAIRDDFKGVIVVHPAEDKDYALEGKRAEDFFKKLGFQEVFDPRVEEYEQEDREKFRFLYISGSQAQRLLGQVRVLPVSYNRESIQGPDKSLMSQEGKTGGIDFRVLPVITQPATGIPDVGLKAPTLAGHQRLRLDVLNEEWMSIQRMLDAGMIPSAQRIKEYLEACCARDGFNQEADRVLNTIAGILRLEEERAIATEPGFKELLIVLESDKSSQEMKLALSKITILAGEPKVIAP